MPSKQKAQNWLDKAWYFTKVLFAVLILMVGSYCYGTYKPNKTAIAQVNEELDIFYMNKIFTVKKKEEEEGQRVVCLSRPLVLLPWHHSFL